MSCFLVNRPVVVDHCTFSNRGMISSANYLNNGSSCFLYFTSTMSERSFLNYPPAREGPSVPYKNEQQVIPVFRGTPLAIGAAL